MSHGTGSNSNFPSIVLVVIDMVVDTFPFHE